MAQKTQTRQAPIASTKGKNVAAGHAAISNTNMVEKQPHDRKAAAGNKGAAGAALAATFIASIEALGKMMETQQMTRKEKLAAVVALDKANREAFHKAMLVRSEAVTKSMEAEQKSNPLVKGLREYFELHPGEQSVYTETSMWKKMALAIDAAWTPDMTMTWPNISAAATAALEAKGKPSADPANPNRAPSSKRKQGRAATSPQAKAVTAVASALKDANGNKLAKNNRNLTAVIEGILDADGGATLEELTEIAAMLQKKLDAAMKANEAAQAALKKAAEPSTQGKEKLADNQTKTHTGAVVTKTDAVGTVKRVSKADKLIADAAKAQAKGERRYSNGRRAHA